MASSILRRTFVALFTVPALASTFPHSDLETRGPNLEWAPCFGELTAKRTECALFNTPLDYNNAATGNASLAVIRYKAFEEPYLGTLWFNSGRSGLVDLTARLYGELLSNMTGGHYDIVSWDSRGTYSLPGLLRKLGSSQDVHLW